MIDALDSIAALGQCCSGLIVLCGYLPQVVHIRRTKQVEGVSKSAWVLWLCSGVLGLFYALVQYAKNGEGLSLLFTCAVNVFFILFLLSLLMRYTDDKEVKVSSIAA